MVVASHSSSSSRSSSALEAVHVVCRVAAKVLRWLLLLLLMSWVLLLLHAEVLAHAHSHAAAHTAHVGIRPRITSNFVLAQIFVQLAAARCIERAPSTIALFVGWWALLVQRVPIEPSKSWILLQQRGRDLEVVHRVQMWLGYGRWRYQTCCNLCLLLLFEPSLLSLGGFLIEQRFDAYSSSF
jgi:hypothetical protein